MREPKDTVFPAIMEYGPLMKDRFFPVRDSRSLKLSTQVFASHDDVEPRLSANEPITGFGVLHE